MLDYDYIKIHYRLIAVELSRQKELTCRSKNNSVNRVYWKVKKLENNGNAKDAGKNQSMFVLTTLEKV